MYTLIIRTVITYFFLVGVMRIMGKRQIGELELSEFITTLLLSELAALPIADSTIPLVYSVIPIVILLSLEMIFSILSLKNRKVNSTFSGKPAVIIRKGKIYRSEMAKNRLNLDELLSQLRIKNIFDISEVDYAILEDNGQLSVIKKTDSQGVTVKDLKLSPQNKGISHNVIIDGEISDKSLKMAGKSRSWLYETVKNKKTDVESVFLLSVDDSDNVNIVKKEDTK